jgi:hypothetical protein
VTWSQRGRRAATRQRQGNCRRRQLNGTGGGAGGASALFTGLLTLSCLLTPSANSRSLVVPRTEGVALPLSDPDKSSRSNRTGYRACHSRLTTLLPASHHHASLRLLLLLLSRIVCVFFSLRLRLISSLFPSSLSTGSLPNTASLRLPLGSRIIHDIQASLCHDSATACTDSLSTLAL